MMVVVVVAAASPALWLSAAATAPGAFDNSDDYHRHDVMASEAAPAGLTVRIDCGQEDPFYSGAYLRRWSPETAANQRRVPPPDPRAGVAAPPVAPR